MANNHRCSGERITRRGKERGPVYLSTKFTHHAFHLVFVLLHLSNPIKKRKRKKTTEHRHLRFPILHSRISQLRNQRQLTRLTQEFEKRNIQNNQMNQPLGRVRQEFGNKFGNEQRSSYRQQGNFKGRPGSGFDKGGGSCSPVTFKPVRTRGKIGGGWFLVSVVSGGTCGRTRREREREREEGALVLVKITGPTTTIRP